MKDEKGVTLGKVTGMEHFRKKKNRNLIIRVIQGYYANILHNRALKLF